MKGSDGWLQGYNAQAAVESTLQLIVGQSVTQAGNDKEQIAPMVEVIERQSGTATGCDPGRQRLLLGEEPRVSGDCGPVWTADRGLYCDRQGQA